LNWDELQMSEAIGIQSLPYTGMNRIRFQGFFSGRTTVATVTPSERLNDFKARLGRRQEKKKASSAVRSWARFATRAR
jgi:hypothetical protein